MRPRSIVITGASDGIGRALALRYAAPGILLGLVGRRAGRLEEVIAACRARGAEAEAIVVDVRSRADLAERLSAFDTGHPVDVVIANAGVALAERDETEIRTVFDTNFVGALNTVLPLLPAMTARGHGQIAFTSSIAAIAPLPDGAAYSASKAALLAYGLALRQRLAPGGIQVSVICPGFIATAMGAQYKGWRPLELSPEAAAARIAAGLARNKALIAFPRTLYAAARLSSAVPESILRLAMRGFSFSIAAER